MLSKNQDERPTASQILLHPLFVREEMRRQKELDNLEDLGEEEEEQKRKELEKFSPRKPDDPETWPIPGPTVCGSKLTEHKHF